MTNFQTGIITLMKCAVTNECARLPDGFSLEEAETFTVKQNITTLVYEGAVICGISPKEPVMQRMFQQYVKLMLHSERQMTEVDRICKAFDSNDIDYLPLKGCNIKKRYPKPELRYMGDADILIRVEQYERICRVAEALGLTKGLENQYEYHWHNAALKVEFHKSLVSSETRLFYDYWKDAWKKAEKALDNRFVLSAEDDFLFQLTHFAKHYRKSGIGVRYLLDLWVFLRTSPDLNKEYLEQELRKLNLLEFYRNIQELLCVWFENGEHTAKTDLMTDYLFSGNSWGSWKNTQVFHVRAAKGNMSYRKVAFLASKLFPSLTIMTYQYPLLKKIPVLLPVFWILRLGKYWILNSKNQKKAMYIMNNVSDEMVNRRQEHMQSVGLSFDE